MNVSGTNSDAASAIEAYMSGFLPLTDEIVIPGSFFVLANKEFTFVMTFCNRFFACSKPVRHTVVVGS
jgi:hypothetical protein